MKSYIDYQNEIKDYQEVTATIKTTEKIAASSIHRLKQETINLSTYVTHLKTILDRFLMFSTKHSHPFLHSQKTGKKALVIFTSDNGLVGGLWHRLINLALQIKNNYQLIFIIGEKGKKFLEEENVAYTQFFSQDTDIPEVEQTWSINNQLLSQVEQGEISSIDFLYAKFINLAEQIPALISFIPFQTGRLTSRQLDKRSSDLNQSEIAKGYGWPIFEPGSSLIFNLLVQRLTKVFLYQILIESKLSELSARTVAMEHAATKADNLLQKLKLNYAKQRRRLITQKQLASFSVHKNL